MVTRHKVFSVLAFFIAVFITFSVILSGCGKTKTAGESNAESKIAPRQGYLAPDFELEDLAGERVALSGFRGKTVVINFWSMGCRYCLEEMPDFDAFNRSKPEDVIVLMINLDKDRSRLAVYIENQGYSFKVLKDEVGETARSYLIRGIPATFVIGRDGVVRHRVEGLITQEVLNSLIADEPQDKAPLTL